MRNLLRALPLLLLAALSGCVTKYGTDNWTGGYAETQVGPDRWEISFAGNGYTTRETVQTFWLYRAAELTQEKGYDGFQIVTHIALISYDRARPAMLVPVQYSEKPSMVATIRMLKGPIEARPPIVFDAAALKRALEPYVKGTMCQGNVCPHVHTYLMPPVPA